MESIIFMTKSIPLMGVIEFEKILQSMLFASGKAVR